MKVYTKIILDKNNNVIYEDSYDYNGSILMTMGIHYDFKSLSGVRAMKKKAKIAERREKKKSKFFNSRLVFRLRYNQRF